MIELDVLPAQFDVVGLFFQNAALDLPLPQPCLIVLCVIGFIGINLGGVWGHDPLEHVPVINLG